jgi:hypothetical protein
LQQGDDGHPKTSVASKVPKMSRRGSSKLWLNSLWRCNYSSSGSHRSSSRQGWCKTNRTNQEQAIYRSRRLLIVMYIVGSSTTKATTCLSTSPRNEFAVCCCRSDIFQYFVRYISSGKNPVPATLAEEWRLCFWLRTPAHGNFPTGIINVYTKTISDTSRKYYHAPELVAYWLCVENEHPTHPSVFKQRFSDCRRHTAFR